jgi:glycosyltransferase 2 family protein
MARRDPVCAQSDGQRRAACGAVLARRRRTSFSALTSSFLVATFFNNFLPSNIGGDVIRVTDTAPAAGSKTLAATIVLIDRGMGLLGLVLVAAIGASLTVRLASSADPLNAVVLWAGFGIAAVIAVPALMMPKGVASVLRPIRVVHPEWIDERIVRLTDALSRFRQAPGALIGCFVGAIAVQGILVLFYLAIATSLRIPIGAAELAVVIPVSFIVQMLPISMNGFGVREATFGLYFARLGLPLESALLLSFTGAALIMLVSLAGAAVYLTRRQAARPSGQP